MLPQERLQLILSMVDANGFVTIPQLIAASNASKSTIHRDLEELERENLLQRVRGGASSLRGSVTNEPPVALRQDAFADEKKRIAVKAMTFIHNRDTVLLDSGTTVHELSKLIANCKTWKNLMVSTNDIISAYILSFNSAIDLIVSGGLVRKEYHTLVGSFGEYVIDQLHADRVFLSADAVDIHHGCMCYSLEEAQIKKAILRAAKEVILLCDHSKFEAVAFVNICRLSDVGVIITGQELDEEIAQQIRDMGIQLILV